MLNVDSVTPNTGYRHNLLRHVDAALPEPPCVFRIAQPCPWAETTAEHLKRRCYGHNGYSGSQGFRQIDTFRIAIFDIQSRRREAECERT